MVKEALLHTYIYTVNGQLMNSKKHLIYLFPNETVEAVCTQSDPKIYPFDSSDHKG